MKTPSVAKKSLFPALASLILFLAASHQASATISMYQAAVKADGSALHLWSFDGADAASRQDDGVGSNDLSPASYGTGATNPSFGSGFDGSSSAVTITRGSAAAAFLTSSAITLPTTVSYEAIVRRGSLSSGAGYMFGAYSGGERSYFTVLFGGGSNSLVTITGNSYGNQNVIVGSPAATDWYYLAVTMSYDSINDKTTVNTWSANLSQGGTLTQSAINQVENGTFITSVKYGVGAVSNEGASIQEAYPGEIDEIALYSGLKNQAFFEGNLALIVPEPSSALLVLFGGASLVLRRRR